ncbi:MAG: tetratricopeptide repeat protein [Akkermansiaceae bacterium]
MKGKIVHAIVFLVIAAIVATSFVGSDPEDPAKLASQLPALLLAGLYIGFLFVMYLLPMLSNKATNAVLASNETVQRLPIHSAQAAYARGDYEEAIELYYAIAQEETDNRIPWVEISKIQHDKLESPETALNTLKTALEEHEWPADDAAYFMGRIAEIYLEDLEDKETSVGVLRQIVELFPDTQYSASANQKINEIDKRPIDLVQ